MKSNFKDGVLGMRHMVLYFSYQDFLFCGGKNQVQKYFFTFLIKCFRHLKCPFQGTILHSDQILQNIYYYMLLILFTLP